MPNSRQSSLGSGHAHHQAPHLSQDPSPPALSPPHARNAASGPTSSLALSASPEPQNGSSSAALAAIQGANSREALQPRPSARHDMETAVSEDFSDGDFESGSSVSGDDDTISDASSSSGGETEVEAKPQSPETKRQRRGKPRIASTAGPKTAFWFFLDEYRMGKAAAVLPDQEKAVGSSLEEAEEAGRRAWVQLAEEQRERYQHMSREAQERHAAESARMQESRERAKGEDGSGAEAESDAPPPKGRGPFLYYLEDFKEERKRLDEPKLAASKISKLAAQKWNALPKEQQQPYINLSEAGKAVYAEWRSRNPRSASRRQSSDLKSPPTGIAGARVTRRAAVASAAATAAVLAAEDAHMEERAPDAPAVRDFPTLRPIKNQQVLLGEAAGGATGAQEERLEAVPMDTHDSVAAELRELLDESGYALRQLSPPPPPLPPPSQPKPQPVFFHVGPQMRTVAPHAAQQPPPPLFQQQSAVYFDLNGNSGPNAQPQLQPPSLPLAPHAGAVSVPWSVSRPPVAPRPPQHPLPAQNFASRQISFSAAQAAVNTMAVLQGVVPLQAQPNMAQPPPRRAQELPRATEAAAAAMAAVATLEGAGIIIQTANCDRNASNLVGNIPAAVPMHFPASRGGGGIQNGAPAAAEGTFAAAAASGGEESIFQRIQSQLRPDLEALQELAAGAAALLPPRSPMQPQTLNVGAVPGAPVVSASVHTGYPLLGMQPMAAQHAQHEHLTLLTVNPQPTVAAVCTMQQPAVMPITMHNAVPANVTAPLPAIQILLPQGTATVAPAALAPPPPASTDAFTSAAPLPLAFHHGTVQAETPQRGQTQQKEIQQHQQLSHLPLNIPISQPFSAAPALTLSATSAAALSGRFASAEQMQPTAGVGGAAGGGDGNAMDGIVFGSFNSLMGPSLPRSSDFSVPALRAAQAAAPPAGDATPLAQNAPLTMNRVNNISATHSEQTRR